MKQTILAICLIITLECSIFADEFETKKEQSPLTFSEKFFNDSFIKLYIMVPDPELSIRHMGENSTAEKIEYFPNTSLHLGIELHFYNIGLSFTNKMEFLDTAEDERKYGKTEYRDIMLNYYSGKIGVEIAYQKYQGFYLRKPEHHGYSTGDPQTIRPDLKLKNYSGRFYYDIADRNNFSIASVLDHPEKHQKGMSCAFMVMLFTDRLTFESDYSLIPPVKEADYGRFSGLQSGKYTAIGAAPGVGITSSLFNFFIATSLFLGGGFQSAEYTVASGNVSNHGGFVKGHFNISAGYNGENIFAGGVFNLDWTSSKIKDQSTTSGNGLNVGLSDVNIKIFSGVRL